MYVYRQISFKELAFIIMEADKFQDYQGQDGTQASWWCVSSLKGNRLKHPEELLFQF